MNPQFDGSVNIALKIPKANYQDTLAFYRDVLRLPVTKDDPSSTPTVAETHRVTFGVITLWLDRVDTYSRPDVWLETETTNLDAAVQRLAEADIHPCDEIEPISGPGLDSHWIKDPAGIVHHLVQHSMPAAT
ncbi:VOC family protein [Phytoactinopolyspora limicola]|uniref:VOC family protein n=1 Tax=Phytoactinopolyspora limicola TaxID=2715536 RepID=UPI00140C1BD0|nr:VOC family protein [Phytoactinopolyspora limicola]